MGARNTRDRFRHRDIARERGMIRSRLNIRNRVAAESRGAFEDRPRFLRSAILLDYFPVKSREGGRARARASIDRTGPIERKG